MLMSQYISWALTVTQHRELYDLKLLCNLTKEQKQMNEEMKANGSKKLGFIDVHLDA